MSQGMNILDEELNFLKERLAFGQAQLKERDLQIEHYKSLVKTLEDLLSNTLSNEGSAPSPDGISLRKKNSIKGRKVVSFHDGKS